nr:T9SS type A sorting domain-containing protein [Bacteroidia bacterium]
DYNSYSNPLILTVYDPITGGYNSVVGEVVNQEPCEVICPRIVTPNQPSSMAKFKSDLRTKEIDLQLSVGPVPFNNFIDIISNSTIDKIVVYDMNGKKVLNSTNLENGKLNTSQLKSGAYYVQVHLSDNIVKSIKIIKQ